MKKLRCFLVKSKLLSYARGRDLTEAQREKVKAHVDRCSSCQLDVRVFKNIIEQCRRYSRENPPEHSNTGYNFKPIRIRCRFLRYILAWLWYYKEIIQIERHRIARGFVTCLTVVMGGYILWFHTLPISNFLVVASDNQHMRLDAGRNRYSIDSVASELLVSAEDRARVKVKTPSVEVEGKNATFFVKRDEEGNTDVGVTYAYDSVGVRTSRCKERIPAGFKYTISPEGEFSDKVEMDEEEIERWENKLISYSKQSKTGSLGLGEPDTLNDTLHLVPRPNQEVMP